MKSRSQQIEENFGNVVRELREQLDIDLAEMRTRHAAEQQRALDDMLNTLKARMTTNLILVDAVQTTNELRREVPAAKYALPPKEKEEEEDYDPILEDDSDEVGADYGLRGFVVPDGYEEEEGYSQEEEEEEEEEEDDEDSGHSDINLEYHEEADERNYPQSIDDHGFEAAELVKELGKWRRNPGSVKFEKLPIWGKELAGFMSTNDRIQYGEFVRKTYEKILRLFTGNNGCGYSKSRLQTPENRKCAFCGTGAWCTDVITITPNNTGLLYESEVTRLYAGPCCVRFAAPLVALLFYMFQSADLSNKLEVYKGMLEGMMKLTNGLREKQDWIEQRFPSSNTRHHAIKKRSGKRVVVIDDDDDDEEYKEESSSSCYSVPELVPVEETPKKKKRAAPRRRVSTRRRKRPLILDLSK